MIFKQTLEDNQTVSRSLIQIIPLLVSKVLRGWTYCSCSVLINRARADRCIKTTRSPKVILNIWLVNLRDLQWGEDQQELLLELESPR